MTHSEVFTRIDRIFNDALKRPPGDRASFLDTVCGAEEEVLREVESLLAAASEMGEDFLEESVLRPDEDRQELGEGSYVGAYRVLKEIGWGGMGKVYLAARDDDVYQQEVAIKVLKRGLDTEEIVRRFRHERQLLARLEHPYIVRILDGGTTGDGLPYFVMEHVEGEVIDRYCDAHDLCVRSRLELFREVCSAVGFAHRNLVVHRDLKPQNILVNHRGEPKLLDFGIAKLLEPGQASLTWAGVRPMTPEYASPEQIANAPITTASDVYSLGRLLCRLLNGSQPSGDLDSIVLKALEEDPWRRYASVEQFSEDLGRYLEGLPVHARQSTVLYRVGKFVRRHRLGVAVTSLALVAVLAFALSMMVLWNQASEERRRAEETAELLEEAAASLFDLAEIRMESDDLEAAEELVRDAVEILSRRRVEDPLQARALNNLAVLLKAKGDFEAAEERYRESLAMRIRLVGEEHADVATAKHNLAAALKDQGRYDEAEKLYRESLALRIALYGESSAEVMTTLNNLALLLMDQGDLQAAESVLRQVVEIRRGIYGPRHSKVGSALVNLGFALRRRQDYREAEVRYGEAMEIFTEHFGPDHSNVANVLRHQALLRLAQGRLGEAEDRARRALLMFRRTKSVGHWRIAEAESVLGACLLALGRAGEATPLMRSGYEALRMAKGDTARQTREALERLEERPPETR